MVGLLLLTIVSFFQFNKVSENELIDAMSARTGESASHINTWLEARLGEVRETVESPILDQALKLNPQLDLTRNDESIRLIDELNQSRWKYVSTVYPNEYAALHIINYLQPDEWNNPEMLGKLKARYYNVKDGTNKTDPWAQEATVEAAKRYSTAGGVYDSIFKPVYSQAYGRNMVLMEAWKKDDTGKVVAGAAASLTIETIQQIAQQTSYGDKGYGFLLAQDGTFMTHPNASWNMKEKTSTVDDENMQKLGKLAANGQSGIFRFTDNGEKKIAFYNPISIAGWTLVTVVDENELFIPANKLLVLLLIISSIIIIFTLMFAYIVSLILNLKRSNAAREELEEAQKHLLNLDRMKDEFLTKVCHELKTPLHGIMGLAECTKDELANQQPGFGENLDLILRSGERLTKLVDEIADFSILKYNQVRLNRTRVYLQDLAQMVITLEQFFANEKKVKLENEVPPDLPPVFADSERVMQILHNLVRNALKFTAVGKVVVEAHLEGEDTILISVSDTGIGIPQTQLETIFNPFEQGDPSRGNIYGGLGLGLSISKSLVELHHSVLTVVSNSGKGSCFRFSLPRWNGEEPELPKKTTPAPASMVGQIQGSPAVEPLSSEEDLKPQPGVPRILAVDDEEINLTLIKNCFYGLHYKIDCVKDGEAALKKINENDYDLVLLDMMMPGLNGIEVCREIRKKYPENQLPIIITTVRNRPEDIEVAFMAKANDYITKPFHKKELLARAQAQLHSKEVYETERKIHQAEISVLQAQIQLHFLYNTMNTITALCRIDPLQAAEILEELSNYLQGKFRFNSLELIPLKQELDLVQSYLAIEQVRYGKRLRIEYDIETNANPLIPPLILQPLVENAVKHGVYPKRNGGTVRISIKEVNGETVICVADDGVGMASAKLECLLNDKDAQEVGIGLKNIHKRLLKHYGCGLDIQSSLNQGTIVTVKIPSNEVT